MIMFRHPIIPLPPHLTPILMIRKRASYPGQEADPNGRRSITVLSFPCQRQSLERACDPFLVREIPEEVTHGGSAKCVSSFKETQNEMAPFWPPAMVTSGGDARSC